MSDETKAEPKTIAAEIIARARAAAFNEFMDAIAKVLPDGPVRASVRMFQASWREAGDYDAQAVYGEVGNDSTTSAATEAPRAADVLARAGEELPKLRGDRIDDARTRLWEAKSLCNVGRAAYGDGDLDVYNTLGAILLLIEGAEDELNGMGKA